MQIKRIIPNSLTCANLLCGSVAVYMATQQEFVLAFALIIAGAIFEHLSAKLPVSRLQRDLTDSTVLRNVGVPMAHSMIAFRSIMKGLNKLLINRAAIDQDLEDNWAVVAEGIQTILRREEYPSPYEALKALTRTNSQVTEQTMREFIETLDVAESVKEELRALTPQSYTGIAMKY